MNQHDLCEELIRHATGFYRFGWLLGTSGNLSCRIPENGRFMITASGKDKGALKTSDFLRLNDRGEVEFEEGQEHENPSAETAIHQVVYQKLPAVGAIYHVHDPNAALCGRRDRDAGSTKIEGWEMIKGLGVWDRSEIQIPVLKNWTDVPKIADEIAGLIDNLNVPGVNIEGHGVYAWGKTPAEAKRFVETFAYLFEVSWKEGATR